MLFCFLVLIVYIPLLLFFPFMNTTTSLISNAPLPSLQYEQSNLDLFELNDDDLNSNPMRAIDPDSNFYAISENISSKYYNETSFNNMINDTVTLLTVIRFYH